MPRPRERSTLLKSVPRAPGRDRARQGDRSRPDRGLVRGRGPDRAEEQDHPALGTTGNAAFGAARSAHRFHLHLRGYLPRRWQGSRARPARLQHRGDEPAPRRNRRRSGSRQARRTRRRPGRMAPLGRPRASRQHHARGAPAQMPGTQPRRERLAVHARQLALEPGVRILHRPCRPLLRGLEQAHRAALDDHVHRPTRVGQWVLINGSWYKISEPGNGPFSLTGQPSACGTAREVGTFSHRLPADMVVTNPKHREITEKIWQLPEGTLPDRVGLHAVAQSRALKDGRPNCYWTMTSNNMQAGPNINGEIY